MAQGPFVNVHCTDNGSTVKATMVSKTPQMLVVFFVTANVKLHMPWKTNQYVGNMAGREFTSNGKTVNS